MIMMTTEEERRSDPHSRNSFSKFDPQKPLGYNHRIDFVKFSGKNFNGESLTIPKTYETPRPTIGSYNKLSPSTDKSFYQDDGYSTDSKSNTSPSTTSPLSSSFSSLSTFDGSFHSPPGGVHTNPHNANYTAMHGNAPRGPIQKLSLIQGNGKIQLNRHAFVTAKKKDTPTEMQESPANLEDRLRALTTIEEEEPALPNRLGKETSRKFVAEHPGHHQVFSNEGREEGIETYGRESSSGFFRAVPVEIVAHQYSQDQRHPGTNSESVDSLYPIPPSPARDVNEKKWHDYRRYFEKDCDIPLHNIDSSNKGKFINTGSDNPTEKDINRQLATNSPASQDAQLVPNSPTRHWPPEMGRNIPDMGSHDQYGPSSFHDNPNHSLTVHPAPYHGYQLDQHDSWNQNTDYKQINASTSIADLRLQSLTQTVHQSSMNRNGDSYYSNSQHPLQYNDHDSGLRSHHHQQQQWQQQQWQHQQQQQQQQQFVNQQHFQQPQHQDLLNANHLSQQNVDGRFAGPQLWSTQDHSNKSNSLPRHYGDLRHHPMFYSENQQNLEDDAVLRRSWASSSTRALPDRVERHSMPPDSRSQHLLECEKLNSMGAERYSLDLGNIPQLQKQIRATSEMCLQASKRHVFASSADIYKLFQGQKQKKPVAPSPINHPSDFVGNRDNSHRHSFHATPNGSWIRSHQIAQQEQIKYPRDVAIATNNTNHTPSPSTNQPSSYRIPSSPGPLRADHSIPLPQSAYISNNNYPPPLSSSSMLPIPLLEIPYIQRQSSGYSSENELQQIEQNALAAKRTKDNNYPSHGVINPDQEFVPVNPSLDQDSSSSLPDSEPVYVNQPMLANARALDVQTKASPPPPLPPRPHRHSSPLTSSNGQPESRGRVSNHAVMSENINKQNGNTAVKTRMVTRQNSSPNSAMITQHQIIHFTPKPVTINSYVPSLSYTNTNYPNGQNGEDTAQMVGGHILSLAGPELHSSEANFSHDRTSNGNNNKNNLLGVTRGSNSFKSQRSNASPCPPLSPLEVAQALDVPFATSVISDESGDRLSTLV